MLHCRLCGGQVNSQQMKIGGYIVQEGMGQKVGGGLLYLTGGGGGCLAAHAGRVDGFRWDQIQILVVWDLIEAVTIFQKLDVQILIDLLEKEEKTKTFVRFLTAERQIKPMELQQWLMLNRSMT